MLEKFMTRKEVLKTYKQLVKSINRIDDISYRTELTNWLRHDFKLNKNLSDEVRLFSFDFSLDCINFAITLVI